MFSRHELVRLSAAGWDAVRLAAPTHQQAAIARWAEHDWPATVRRRDPDATGDVVCLGFSLPPDASGGKQRIAFQTPLDHVRERVRALALHDAIPAAPAVWTAGLTRLERDAREFSLHVYGSLAMQALTGQAYLRPRSDIDLLFHPVSKECLEAGVRMLAAHASELPIDGEVVFPSGAAVAWKEWHATALTTRVLVKEIGGVRLAHPASLMESFQP